MNVFVTGGSRGIGRAIVLKMVKEGAGCAFSFRTQEEAAKETVELAKSIDSTVPVKYYAVDLKDPAKVDAVSDTIIEDFDTIDAVVNNAGVLRNNAAAFMSNEEWDEVIATNLSGPFYVIRSFLMHFIANRKGRIINISSLAQEGSSGQINYAASKAGLIGMTKTLSREYGPKGITSNIVTVGYVETQMTEAHMAENIRRMWLEYCPLRRIGTAEEIAGLVYYLCTDEAGFINGEVIRVSGGLTYAP